MQHYLFRTILVVSLSCAGTVSAVTLGQARVLSFLGQPLEAEIDLIGLKPGQQQDLNLRIANDQHFKRLNIFYTEFLNSLSFDVAQLNGRWIVHARTKRPAPEPYLDFPLHMSWPGGELIKQYTLLLDPPKQRKPALATRKARNPSPAMQPPSVNSANTYGPIRPGEILTAIAQKLKPAGITTWQMSVVLFRANPHAFIKGNIDRLRVGSMLTIPQLEVISELDNKTAVAEFSAEATRWEAPSPSATSPRTAEAAENPAPDATPKTGVSAREPEAEAEPADATTAEELVEDDQLRIVSGKAKSDVIPDDRQELHDQWLVTMEEVESNRITTDAIESRLARMEAELERMQRLVELKDTQIAALESEAAARKASDVLQAVRATESAEMETAAAAGQQTPAPISVERQQPLPTDAAPARPRAWYEEYLWPIWAVLGLMALAALTLLLRRPREHAAEATVAELTGTGESTSPPMFETRQTAPSIQVEETHDEHRDELEDLVAELDKQASAEIESELPELDIPEEVTLDEDVGELGTDAATEEKKTAHHVAAEAEKTIIEDPAFSDNDLASWVAELENEAERADLENLDDGPIRLDDEIPSILTELDDQLASTSPKHAPIPEPIDLDVVEDHSDGQTETTEAAGEPTEDDAFGMSLDLARAYLEIGDHDGARDMLKQALTGARDPDHREQIEELLAQIG
jgi:pilus assembly protein FimV